MAGVLVQQGEVIMLEGLVLGPPTLRLKLFTNNYTPVQGSNEGNFTEASGSGYADVSMVASWGIAPGNPTEITYPEVTFTFTGALGNVYGYYIVQNDMDALLVAAERFSNGPYNIQNNGDQIKVTVNITLL